MLEDKHNNKFGGVNCLFRIKILSSSNDELSVVEFMLVALEIKSSDRISMILSITFVASLVDNLVLHGLSMLDITL